MIKTIVNIVNTVLESHGINGDVLDSDMIRVNIRKGMWCYIVFEDDRVYVGNYDSNRNIGSKSIYYSDPDLLDIIINNINGLMLKT